MYTSRILEYGTPTQLCEKLDQSFIYFIRFIMLYPMRGFLEEDRLALIAQLQWTVPPFQG